LIALCSEDNTKQINRLCVGRMKTSFKVKLCDTYSNRQLLSNIDITKNVVKFCHNIKLNCTELETRNTVGFGHSGTQSQKMAVFWDTSRCSLLKECTDFTAEHDVFIVREY
jgi:fructose/tagatose bisphosphate aldolase